LVTVKDGDCVTFTVSLAVCWGVSLKSTVTVFWIWPVPAGLPLSSMSAWLTV